LGTKGAIHGFECYNQQYREGNPLPVYSIASGLDYPGVGPQHCYLKDIKRVVYETIDDKECLDAWMPGCLDAWMPGCLDAFMQLSRLEGIIPALESAHAIAHAMKIAKNMSSAETILVNLSGRGDKDADFVANYLSL
jgi:tryptophan synthase beta chain